MKMWGLCILSHTQEADLTAQRTWCISSSPPLLAEILLSFVPRTQLQTNLQMQLLSCHIVHKEGEHLAPHWVLAVGTGLGIEERSLKGQQDTGTLSFHLATHQHWEPAQPLLSPCSVLLQCVSDPHTLRLMGGIRAGQPDSKARSVPSGRFAGAEKHTSSTRAHFQGRGPTRVLVSRTVELFREVALKTKYLDCNLAPSKHSVL